MNNLEPRAKIGDVVKRKGYEDEFKVVTDYSDGLPLVMNMRTKDVIFIFDEDILKNLTTNVSYE